jgi:hypothetical protein
MSVFERPEIGFGLKCLQDSVSYSMTLMSGSIVGPILPAILARMTQY